MIINNLEELIRPYLNNHGKNFISYEANYFLPPGENYGSVMLSVDIKVKNQKSQKEEIIHCVAKMLPPCEALRDYFNTSTTFKKEITHYNSVATTLNEFGKTLGVNNFFDFCAEFLGSRISLNPSSNVVDEDAVFVLKNLKMEGYTVGDRFTGFDLETSKLVLRTMAKMHAAFLSLKFKKPDVFKTKVLPNLGEAMVFVASDDMLDKMARTIQKYAARYPDCVPLLDRIGEGTKKMKNVFIYSKYREPFATLTHTDLWVNNILLKHQDGKPVHNVFIDFPLCVYGNPARDVLFFIYSSTNFEVLQTSVDELIKIYYEELINILQELKCDTSQLTYKLFLEEVDTAARDTEFCHCIFMLTPIYTVRGGIQDMSEWTTEFLVADNEENLHPNFHKKLHLMCIDFARRNWI